MSRLEDIPKKQIFSVPEAYFEMLPSRIQSRILASRPESPFRPVLKYALRYALPVILVAAVLFWYSRPSSDAATILAAVETEDLIYYLHESGLTTDDLLENVDFDNTDLDAIENEVYDLEFQDFNDDEIELELNTL